MELHLARFDRALTRTPGRTTVDERWYTNLLRIHFGTSVRVGDLLFCAGQIPIDPTTGNLVPGDIKAQTERVLENLRFILEDQGLSFRHVVKTTVFLVNLADFAAMNTVYDAWIDPANPPARAAIEARLAHPALKVEIIAIAALD